MRRRLQTLVVSGLAFGGCHGADAPSPDPTKTEAPAAAETQALDARDQYALAHAIQQARSVREDLEGTLARTRGAWIGKRYRWEVAFIPALCGAAGACVVMPFDHKRNPDDPIRQGWLPRLDLSADERASLAESCQAHPRCVIELSGDLSQFELSTEQPTSLTLSKVEIHGTRAAASTESWVLGPKRPVIQSPRRPIRANAQKQLEDAVASGLG